MAEDTQALRVTRPLGALHEPLAVVAFIRKNGFYTSAAASIAHFAEAHDGKVVAEVDADPFFDFTVSPPRVRREETRRVVYWPQNQIVHVAPPATSRDVLLLAGIEPHLRWQQLGGELEQFMRSAGVRDLLTLRTWPAPVPHTRPPILRLITDAEELANSLGLQPTTFDYEGPVDFGGLLSALHEQAGGRVANLSAMLPNYLGIVPNPSAIVALLELVDRIAGSRTAVDEMRQRIDEIRARADEELEKSSEMREAVSQMEAAYESIARGGEEPPLAAEGSADLPSPEELLRDVERLLRGGDPPER